MLRARAIAVAVTLICHVALFTGLAFELGGSPGNPEPPAIEVELMRPLNTPDLPAPRPKAAPTSVRRASPAIASVRPQTASRPPPQPSPQSGPSPAPGPANAEQPSVNTELAKALRATVGCEHANLIDLSPSERRDCERRTRNQRAELGNAQFGINPERQAIFDAGAKRELWWQQPFLGEKPTKGCRPRVTEKPPPFGAGQDWTTAVSCVKTF